MDKITPVNEKLLILREKAESSISIDDIVVENLSKDEIKKIIFELQTHQIELELQNEELRQIEIDLQTSNQNYSNLYNFAPVGYITVNQKGIILESNLTFVKILGRERSRIIHQPFSTYIVNTDQDIYSRLCHECIETNELQSCELKLFTGHGICWVLIESTVVEFTPCKEIQLHQTIIDITKQKKLDLELQKSQKLLDLSFEYAPIPKSLVDKTGKYIQVNQAWCDLFGYNKQEALQMWFVDITHPDDLPTSSKFHAQLYKGSIDHYQDQRRFLTKDGQFITAVLHVNPVFDEHHQIQFTIGQIIDVTEEQRFLEYSQHYTHKLKELQKRIFTIQEEERKHISRELHDDTSQMLTSLHLRMQHIQMQLENTGLNEEINDCLLHIGDIMSHLHDLSLGLHPSLLTELGLNATIKWLVENIRKVSGINIVITILGDEVTLPEIFSTTSFRVIQESVNNAVRHANASLIEVTIQYGEHSIEITVSDDGCGFDIQKFNQLNILEKGLGLIGVKERIEMYGGVFSIQSQIMKGTTIQAKFLDINMSFDY